VCAGVVSAQAPGPAAPTTNNEIIMLVNGDPVYASDVNLAMQGASGRMGAQGNQEQAIQSATDQVVGLKLLSQEARRQGMKESEGPVAELLARMEQQAGDRAALEAGLRRMNMTYELLERAIRESQLVREFIDAKVRSTVEVTDEQVTEFYNGNLEMFRVPEQVRARHILIKVEEGMSDEARGAARGQAAEARKRALAGEDFAALARELSQGPSGPKGGDLGFFAADRMVEPFSRAAFALEPGGISDLVETRFGFHVIKVEERREAGIQSLDEVRESVHGYLVENQTSERTAALVEELKAKAVIGPPEAGGATTPPLPGGADE
jgi:peptidyl-prolyl cis-trans isomerase C